MNRSAVVDLLYKRHASRAILPDAIPDDIVEQLIEATRLAPSCRNNQPWRFLFVETEKGLAKAREALTGGNRAWAVTTPLLVIGYSEEEDDCVMDDGRSYHQFDVGMATMNLMLEATAHGLTARPMSGWDADMISKDFGLGEDEQPIIMVAIGYPGEDESHLPDYYKGLGDQPRTRKTPDEIIRRV